MTRSSRPRARALAKGALVVLAALSVALPAFADAPIVHEYVPFDPTSESDLGVVTTEGGFEATKMTRSGVITAPDPGRPITEKTPTYGPKPAVPEDKWSPDRDTRRVDHVSYADPFRPRLAPFKRLYALDAVDVDYSLYVRDKSRKKVDVGKESISAGHAETFYVDLPLDLRAGEAILIPTALGGTVIKRAHLSPTVGFRLERDGAENLYIVADGGGKARLIAEMEAPYEGFGGVMDYDWVDLAKAGTIAKLPSSVQKAADEVAKDLKIDKASMRPRDVIRLLVEYFREFKESEDPPPNTGDIYLDIVRSKKGVCRHRAFGFLVTALGLGIPTRFVHNEAHAWVEVHDGLMWRRIDLGGAGRVMDDKSEKPEKPQPQFEPPADPFTWPAGATKGSDLVPPTAPPTPPTSTGTPPPTPPPAASSAAPSSAPPSKVTLTLGSAGDPLEVHRSKKLSVKGTVTASTGAACKGVRVDILLEGSAKSLTKQIGYLITDDDGNFAGDVTVPTDLAYGDYTVHAHTPGAGTCGQGTSE